MRLGVREAVPHGAGVQPLCVGCSAWFGLLGGNDQNGLPVMVI